MAKRNNQLSNYDEIRTLIEELTKKQLKQVEKMAEVVSKVKTGDNHTKDKDYKLALKEHRVLEKQKTSLTELLKSHRDLLDETKTNRKDRNRYDTAMQYAYRGIGDRLSQMAGFTSVFTAGGAFHYGFAALAGISVLYTVIDRLASEVKANREITLEATKLGFGNQRGARLLGEQFGALRSNSPEERAEIVATALKNFMGDTLTRSDYRVHQMGIAKMAGENMELLAQTMAAFRFESKAGNREQSVAIHRLREVSQKTQVTMDEMLSIAKQSIDATRHLYVALGPQQTQILQTAVASVAGAGRQQREQIMSLISTLLSNPQFAASMGVIGNLERLKTLDANQSIEELGVILKRVLEHTDAGRGMGITDANLLRQMYQNLGFDIVSARSALETALTNLPKVISSGDGWTREQRLRKTIVTQDPRRWMEHIIGELGNINAGIGETNAWIQRQWDINTKTYDMFEKQQSNDRFDKARKEAR